MKTKGQGFAYMALWTLLVLFTVIMIYAVLGEPIQEHIINQAKKDAIYPEYNQTYNNLEIAWKAWPWIMIFSAFLMLVMFALARSI